jgi:hypothetical protein
MAEEIKEVDDSIVSDIEAALEKVGSGYRSGCRMLIHPDGTVEIATGDLAKQSLLGNPHYSCCCCWG